MKQVQSPYQYKVLIERDEDGFFVASVPALPGCHTQAKTMPALRQRIREAIRLCLSVAKTNPRYRQKINQFAYDPLFVGMEMITIR
ncbi:MAG: type II toxin-antitoxin system HicB family antitoxin [Patescibacteria group bacterium]